MSLTTKVIRGTKWTTASTITLAIVAVLKISILARILDRQDFGLMAMMTFIMGFIELFNDMGLSTAILHKQDITKKEYASLYWFNLFLSICLYFILCTLTPLISIFYNQATLNVLVPLLGLNVVISALGRQFKVIEHKHLSFKTVSLIEILGALTALVLAIFLAKKNYGVFTLVYSVLFQTAFTNILFLVVGLNKRGLLMYFKFADTYRFLKIGGYHVGGQVVNYFNRDLDILIIGKFFSAEALGGYSLAKQLVFRPTQIVNPILVKVASPTLATIQKDPDKLKKGYLKLVNIVSSINIPIYLLMIAFAPWIVNIIYGAGFSNLVLLVQILSVYMILRAIGNPVGSLVVATGKTQIEFFWNLFTLLVMPLPILLGAQFGLEAIAIGIALSMVLLLYPSWRFLITRMIEVSFISYLKAAFNVRYDWVQSGLARNNKTKT